MEQRVLLDPLADWLVGRLLFACVCVCTFVLCIRYNKLQSKIRKTRRRRTLRLKKLQTACPLQARTFAQRASVGKEIIAAKSEQNKGLRDVLSSVGDFLKTQRGLIMHDMLYKVCLLYTSPSPRDRG